MSRSKRKTPIGGMTTSTAQKKFKEQEHRAERSKVRQDLKQNKEILPHPKEYGNEWASPRDGKQWFGEPSYFYLARKSITEWCIDFKKWMRK